MRYRRAIAGGATYFFTVNLAERNADTLLRHVDALRKVIDKVKQAHPFSVIAMVVLPEHLHAGRTRNSGLAARGQCCPRRLFPCD